MLEAAKQLPASTEYSVVTVPKSRVMYGSFPYRNSLSYMLGPMKVQDRFGDLNCRYPAITAMMNSNDIKPVGCAEIYHWNPEPIEYMMYLDNKEIFDKLHSTQFVKANLL